MLKKFIVYFFVCYLHIVKECNPLICQSHVRINISAHIMQVRKNMKMVCCQLPLYSVMQWFKKWEHRLLSSPWLALVCIQSPANSADLLQYLLFILKLFNIACFLYAIFLKILLFFEVIPIFLKTDSLIRFLFFLKSSS